jgi:hypothetical protein
VSVIEAGRMRWGGGECGREERGEKFMEGYMGKLEGKRPHGKPKRKWENNVKLVLKK